MQRIRCPSWNEINSPRLVSCWPIFFLFNLLCYLLYWQNSPLKPDTHSHVNLFTKSVHWPPFWQGLDRHSSISEIEYTSQLYGAFCFTYKKDRTYNLTCKYLKKHFCSKKIINRYLQNKTRCAHRPPIWICRIMWLDLMLNIKK